MVNLSQTDIPWCALGDYNAYLDSSKASNCPSNFESMEDFRECVRECELVEHLSDGLVFTWVNNRLDDPIARKLDRTLVGRVCSKGIKLTS
ncbi:hypothetical protein LINPERHAP2_LOCUS4622, partial [Linum perenne]